MINFQVLTDKTAIGLSLLCTLHCLALPFAFVLFPSVAALQMNNEAFHLWMILAVLPTSVYALTMGCRKHKQAHLLAIGLLGLACLISAVFLGDYFFGEMGEKILTLIGAVILAYGHYRNHRLCQHQENCECSSHRDVISK